MKLKKADIELFVGLIEDFLEEKESTKDYITKEGIERLIEIRFQYTSMLIFNSMNQKWIDSEKGRIYEKVK